MTLSKYTIQRQIGKLLIVDLFGDLGATAARDEVIWRVSDIRKYGNRMNLLINLKPVEMMSIDTWQAFVCDLPSSDVGFFEGAESVMNVVRQHSHQPQVKFIKNLNELVRTFGTDMVTLQSEFSGYEQRGFPRIKSALPVTFSCFNENEDKIEFSAVATDMCLSGLFAEYVDLNDAMQSSVVTNPYDLKLLDLKITTANGSTIEAKGKVVRRRKTGDQMGIGVEFYHLSQQDQEKINALLAD